MPKAINQVRYNSTKRQAILFVGGRTSFPDVYLRLIMSEFDNLDVSIVPTFAAVKDRLNTSPYCRVTLIFSPRSVEAEMETLFELSKQFPNFDLALAFHDIKDIKNFIDAIGDTALMAKLSFLPLRTRIDSAINIFRLLVSGERHICGEVMDYLLSGSFPAGLEIKANMWDQIRSLTAREKDVLGYLSKGEPNKVIAHHLQLSESTVKLHIHHIIGKMGVTNRTEAAIAYVAATGNFRVE